MNKENSVNKLSQTKIWADSEKYFSLFDRHIPSLGKGRTVLLYSIDNIQCILKIVAKNPEASYVVYGDPPVNRMVEKLLPGVRTIDETPENCKKYNIDMNFDCIIMNPPYDGSLHLKILAEAIRHLKDDESKVVNLSPVRWLQDPLAKYKKRCDLKLFSENVVKRIETLDIIDKNVSRELFNNGLNQDCGIYLCSHRGGFDVSSVQNPVIRRLIDKIVAQYRPKIDVCKKDGWRVRIPTVMGGSHTNDSRKDVISALRKILYFKDGEKDGQPWHSFFQKTGNTKATPEITASILLNSETECANYVDSLKTSFCLFFISECMTNTSTQFTSWPWIGDAVNPRTGLKGYLGEWTDDDFCKFFGVTDDEKKIIEETMAKYVKK